MSCHSADSVKQVIWPLNEKQNTVLNKKLYCHTFAVLGMIKLTFSLAVQRMVFVFCSQHSVCVDIGLCSYKVKYLVSKLAKVQIQKIE